MKWELRRNPDYEKLAAMQKRELGIHEGYQRENNGDWIIVDETGTRVALASFRGQGQTKRGSAWNSPDPEGQANARLIADAPQLREALEAWYEYWDNRYDGEPLKDHEVKMLAALKRA
jgi:hypothetical protein